MRSARAGEMAKSSVALKAELDNSTVTGKDSPEGLAMVKPGTVIRCTCSEQIWLLLQILTCGGVSTFSVGLERAAWELFVALCP